MADRSIKPRLPASLPNGTTTTAAKGSIAQAPDQVPNKIALLIQLLRQRRCLLILDNLESVMQAAAPTGTYRAGYAEYGTLLHGLSVALWWWTTRAILRPRRFDGSQQ